MEIKNIKKTNLSGRVVARGGHEKIGSQTVSFTGKLRQVEEKVWQDRLNRLLEKIQVQGKILTKSRNIKELKQYKSLVRNFMQEAVDGSMKLTRNSSWNQRGKHRLLMLVEKVDEQMEELTGLMLSGEAETLEILAKLDEIRGLLVDLYT